MRFREKNYWIELLRGELPGRRSHEAFYPVRQAELTSLDVSSFRPAAVGIHLFPSNDDCQFLIIERSEYDGTHSKQMAFPGGKVDVADENTVYTARRESWEEVGIPFDKGDWLGQLTTVYIPVSSFTVEPHLFFHNEVPEFKLSEREVQATYLFSVHELLDESNCKQVNIPMNSKMVMKNVPCFELQNKIVWGATALILSELRELLKN
jgi:8-oxo-dGTP pyrophosphatase MutT (NUDIX family)